MYLTHWRKPYIHTAYPCTVRHFYLETGIRSYTRYTYPLHQIDDYPYSSLVADSKSLE